MKNFILVLAVLLLLSPSVFALTSAQSGKTTVGINYLIWGYFNNAGTVEANIVTGLNTIRGCGLNITSEATLASPLKVDTSAGTIKVTSVSEGPDGLWWAIGR